MSDLFDVRKEIILITGVGRGWGFARVLPAHGAERALMVGQESASAWEYILMVGDRSTVWSRPLA